MVIVDTSVWIDYLMDVKNAETIWLDSWVEKAGVGLTDLILAEILQGIRTDKLFREILLELQEYMIFSSCGEDIAIRSAENYRFLRSKGLTVRKTVDSVIATFCIEGKHRLLHRDRDFDGFERYLGLNVVHPELEGGMFVN